MTYNYERGPVLKGSTHGLAEALVNALADARDRKFAHSLAGAHALSLACALADARARESAFALPDTRAHACELVRELREVHAEVRVHADALAHSLTVARELAGELANAGGLTDVRAHTAAGALARELAGDLVDAHDLVRVHTAADALARELAVGYTQSTRSTLEASGAPPRVITVSGVARWMSSWVVRALPVGERARYREELYSELYALAEAGCPRRRQLAYALRLAFRVVSLRQTVRRPVPERSR